MPTSSAVSKTPVGIWLQRGIPTQHRHFTNTDPKAKTPGTTNQTGDPRKRNKNLETGENLLLSHPTNRNKKPHLYPGKDEKTPPLHL